MGSSGLIYAAIVAGWAAILVPRWVRQNEEIDQAREHDRARGVRVLEPSAEIARSARSQARHESPPIAVESPAKLAEPVGEYDPGRAGRRRRRVMIVLAFALAVVTVIAVIGTLPLWSVAIPALLLVGYVRLARWAALAEANQPHRRRQLAEPTEARNAPTSRTATPQELEEGGPTEPVDPRGWQPVPVPLPTYLLKDKAPDSAARTIDLTYPGAWTSGRLAPAGSTGLRPVAEPLTGDEDVVEELPEHRTAVGD